MAFFAFGLAGVLVLMAFDPPIGTWTVASLVLIIPALVIGWFAVRSRVLAVAQEREGFWLVLGFCAVLIAISYTMLRRFRILP